MIPSGGHIPPSKQPPDPNLEVSSVSPSAVTPNIEGSPHGSEVRTSSLPPSAAAGAGKSSPLTNGVQNRASPYDRSSSGGATRRKGNRLLRRENPQRSIPGPVKVVNPPALVPEEDGFTLVNCKGKNKTIKLQRKKKPVVVRANAIGLKANQRDSSLHVNLSNQVGGQTCSKVPGSGFYFARAVQGTSVKPVKPPLQAPNTSPKSAGPASRSVSRHPHSSGSSMEVDSPQGCSINRFAVLNDVSELDTLDQSVGTGTKFTELDIQASLKRSSLVEACSDLYPHESIMEDVNPTAQFQSDVEEQAAEKRIPEIENLFCQVNREHIDGTRLLPSSILSSPNPGGLHSHEGGRTYGISESQRIAIADRLSVSTSICSEETVNWCPGEWDYFNDLCISLGLDTDYCIEDVDSDTENGTAQFISHLLKSGCPKPNRR
ncbi:hypothetical protein L1987_16560 [Smallanthus sonchifolius]|uniref:Uncharacterized protein n=1 Tax=Smallanthus sonchifolius TaxID=185202 RepID=A0ACB9IVB8_9ASTR|nr:hypothetical protein L1987_16560 [Smallanthus sonchifolius]